MIRQVFARVVAPIVCAYLIAEGFTACGSTFGQIENAATDSGTSELIRDCSAESRQAFYEAGKPKNEAVEVYRACIKDAGSK